ncbi:unnamed protein product [Chrysoparadoxa australica]
MPSFALSLSRAGDDAATGRSGRYTTGSTRGRTAKRSLTNPFNIGSHKTTVVQEVIGGILGWAAIASNMGFYSFLFTNGSDHSKESTQVLYLIMAGVSTIAMGLVANLPFVVAPSVVYASIGSRPFSPGEFLAGQFLANLGAAILLWFASKRGLQLMPSQIRGGFGCGLSILVSVLGFRSIGLFSANAFVINPFTWKSIIALYVITASLAKGTSWQKYVLAVLCPVILSIIISSLTEEDIFKGFPVSGNPLKDMSSSSLGVIDMSALAKPRVWGYALSTMLSLSLNIMATLLILVDATCLQSLPAWVTDLGDTNLARVIGTTKKFRGMCTTTLVCSALGNLVGVSSQAVFVQSMVSVFAGAKTGLSSCVAGVLFICTAGLSPILPVLMPGHIQGALAVVAALNFFSIIPTINLKTGARQLMFGLPLMLIPLTFDALAGLSIAAVLGYCLSLWVVLQQWAEKREQKIAVVAEEEGVEANSPKAAKGEDTQPPHHILALTCLLHLVTQGLGK